MHMYGVLKINDKELLSLISSGECIKNTTWLPRYVLSFFKDI